MSKILYNKDIIADLTKEIKVELRKFTNLIRKKCTFCSTIENSYFYYEKDNCTYFVCSSCVIKLAMNNLLLKYTNSSQIKNICLKRELLALLNYINTILEEIDENNS